MKSVVEQSYRQLDIILVDDGSPDCCPALCDEWARRDSRITVVHQANGGLSAARNAGIDRARGELITFVDSDDWLSPTTYADALEAMGEADMVEFSFEKGNTPTTLPGATYHDMGRYWLDGEAYRHAYAWNKIYRKHLFDKLRYPEGRVFEDMATLPALLLLCHEVTTTPTGCYHYTDNPAGITAQATGKQLKMLLDAHRQALQWWTDDRYYLHVLNIQIDVCRLLGGAPSLPFRRVRLSQLKGAWLLKALMLNLFGLKALCKIHTLLCRH